MTDKIIKRIHLAESHLNYQVNYFFLPESVFQRLSAQDLEIIYSAVPEFFFDVRKPNSNYFLPKTETIEQIHEIFQSPLPKELPQYVSLMTKLQ